MKDNPNSGNPSFHPDAQNDRIINDSGVDSPSMGVRVDQDPMKKKNPNPFHLDVKNNQSIKGFSSLLEGETKNPTQE